MIFTQSQHYLKPNIYHSWHVWPNISIFGLTFVSPPNISLSFHSLTTTMFYQSSGARIGFPRAFPGVKATGSKCSWIKKQIEPFSHLAPSIDFFIINTNARLLRNSNSSTIIKSPDNNYCITLPFIELWDKLYRKDNYNKDWLPLGSLKWKWRY